MKILDIFPGPSLEVLVSDHFVPQTVLHFVLQTMPEMRCLDQYLKNRNGRWHYHRRVPQPYAECDKRGVIRTSLKTRSVDVARARRDALAEADELYWASLDVRPDAHHDTANFRYKAAKKRAMARGFIYTPIEDLAKAADLNEIVDRVQAVQQSAPNMEADAQALLGTVDLAVHSVREAFKLYCDHIAISDLAGKSDAQKRNWRKVKQRALNNFVALCACSSACLKRLAPPSSSAPSPLPR